MESKGLRQYEDVLSVTLAVFILDILLYSYFVQTSTNNDLFILIDVIITVIAAVMGKKLAGAAGFPVWKVSYAAGKSRKSIIVSILIGIGIIGSNTFILCNYNTDMFSWLSFTNAYQPLFVSLRAALTEETVFRLLIFPGVTWLANKISRSCTVSIVLGALASASAFGLFHNGFYLPFIFGLGLCYIYKKNGLIPAMIIHFLADFIPFTLIYIK